VDHENCRCNVGHTKESNAEAIRILKSEPTHHPIERAKFRVDTPHYRMFPEYIIRKASWFSDYIIRTTPDHFGRWSTPQRKCFANVLGGGQLYKMCSYTFFDYH